VEVSAFQFALMLVRDRSVAEDIVQEAFIKVWASSHTPRTQPGFQRWLYRAIRNLAYDHYRRRQRWARLRFWAPPPLDPLDELERMLGDAELAVALRRLSVRDRLALYLRYFEDQSFAETARILGTREANARLIVHRALGKVRRGLPSAEAVKEVGT
jgi:RNA polymerase sigma factor (sigma-70 family)